MPVTNPPMCAHQPVVPGIPAVAVYNAEIPKAQLHRKPETQHRYGRKLDYLDKHADFLTGLYNQRFFHETLAREIARADRYQHPLTMPLLDVDHFKQVNDTHGHVVGDTALKTLAAILRSTVRCVDFVFRSGGDEFCILVPGTNLTVACGFASACETRSIHQAFGRR